jgi:hypothetical protein
LAIYGLPVKLRLFLSVLGAVAAAILLVAPANSWYVGNQPFQAALIASNLEAMNGSMSTAIASTPGRIRRRRRRRRRGRQLATATCKAGRNSIELGLDFGTHLWGSA